jgi:dipeptide/tripeptide permease
MSNVKVDTKISEIVESETNLSELASSNNELLRPTTEVETKKEKYPAYVFLIVLNEFCERFSFYGLKTILFIYLTKFIRMDTNSATSAYHAFTMFCYFTPVLGRITSAKF